MSHLMIFMKRTFKFFPLLEKEKSYDLKISVMSPEYTLIFRNAEGKLYVLFNKTEPIQLILYCYAFIFCKYCYEYFF